MINLMNISKDKSMKTDKKATMKHKIGHLEQGRE